MGKKRISRKAPGALQQQTAPAPQIPVVTLPAGHYMHPEGVLLEIAPGPSAGQVIVRIQARYDVVFLDGKPLGFATVQGPPQPLFWPAVEQRPQLVLAK